MPVRFCFQIDLMRNYVTPDAAHNAFWDLWSRVALFAISCAVFSTQSSDSWIVYDVTRPENIEIQIKSIIYSKKIIALVVSRSFSSGKSFQEETDDGEITAQETIDLTVDGS